MFYLKRNLPGWERLVRLMLAAGLAVAVFYLVPAGLLRLAGYASGAMLAGTAVFGFCPACALVGRKLADRTS